ncbi:MAG: tetratricopeptide repeat protein, partial [Terrimicrobiaceae bacterium]
MFFRTLALVLLLLALTFASPLRAQAPTQLRAAEGATVREIRYTDEASAFQAAEDLYGAKDYEAALAAFRRFLKNNPKSKLAPKAQLRIADLLLIQGRWSSSFDAY